MKATLVSLFLGALLGAPVFGDVLRDGAVVARRASVVKVNEIKSAVITHQVVKPATATSLAQVSGVLELTLNVEGNICSSEAASLDFLTQPTTVAWENRLSLSVSRPHDAYTPSNLACATFGAPRNVLLPIALDSYFYQGSPTELRYLLTLGYPGSPQAREAVILVHVSETGYTVEIQ